WKVTFAQSGLTADANTTVLTVGSDTYQQSDFAAGTPFYWVNATGSLSYGYSDPVGSSVSGKRFDLTNNPGTSVSNPSGPVTVTGTYVTQYKVTFAQAGIGTDTGTNTVLTEPSPAGNTWSKSQLDGGAVYEWVTDGQSISFAYTTNVDTSP